MPGAPIKSSHFRSQLSKFRAALQWRGSGERSAKSSGDNQAWGRKAAVAGGLAASFVGVSVAIAATVTTNIAPVTPVA